MTSIASRQITGNSADRSVSSGLMPWMAMLNGEYSFPGGRMSQRCVPMTCPPSTSVTATAHAESRCAVAVSKSIAAKHTDRSRSTASGVGGVGLAGCWGASPNGIVTSRGVV